MNSYPNVRAGQYLGIARAVFKTEEGYEVFARTLWTREGTEFADIGTFFTVVCGGTICWGGWREVTAINKAKSFSLTDPPSTYIVLEEDTDGEGRQRINEVRELEKASRSALGQAINAGTKASEQVSIAEPSQPDREPRPALPRSRGG